MMLMLTSTLASWLTCFLISGSRLVEAGKSSTSTQTVSLYWEIIHRVHGLLGQIQQYLTVRIRKHGQRISVHAVRMRGFSFLHQLGLQRRPAVMERCFVRSDQTAVHQKQIVASESQNKQFISCCICNNSSINPNQIF